MKPTSLAPGVLERILGWMTLPLEREPLLGDFEEIFLRLSEEEGRLRAWGWYLGCILKLVPAFVQNSARWRMEMIWNNLKTGWRHIVKHKGYSFINIAGLAVGLACTLFILLWVQNEMSFDRFHSGAKSLFRLEQDQSFSQGTFHVWDVPIVLGPVLKTEVPDIKNVARTYHYLGTVLVRFGEQAFYESSVAAVDPSFFKMFTFPLVRGSLATALGIPNALILSEELAQKCFGREDPLGKTVTLNNSFPMIVSGVMKDMPLNSSLQMKLVVPYDLLKMIGLYNESWQMNSTTTWVELQKGASAAEVGKKITRLVRERQSQGSAFGPTFMLMPLVDIKLYATFGYGQKTGSFQQVAVFSAVALIVLLIACINFMNLATARSANRALEVGLRKAVGASRRVVARQFYGESIVTVVLAVGAALGLVVLLLPAFNRIAGTQLTAAVLSQRAFLLGILAVAAITGIISGSYPAIFLSSFEPIRVLRGSLKAGSKSALFRKTLVVVQFTLSILLLLGTAVVYGQLEYMRTKKLGYDKEHLVYLPLRGEARASYAALKDELLKASRILNASGTSLKPSSMVGDTSWGADWDGKDPGSEVLIGATYVDFDYPETMKVELAAGRALSKSFRTDGENAFLVNEEVSKLMGLDPAAAVGKRFDFIGVRGRIVGVMKNFHLTSVRERIEPRAFLVRPDRLNFAIVRLQAGDIPSALEDVKAAWQKVNPQFPLEYRFFDADFERMYRSDERMETILRVFTAMAVFVACLGLFGLVSYAAEQRTREIGVRKVLGASLPSIIVLMSKEFAAWVAAANIIAWPLGYLITRHWLQGFAFRTEISWALFPAAGLGTLFLALITVGFQALRAGRSSPVKALKHE